MMRTISIKGEASCFMKPDMCTISFKVMKTNEVYKNCVKELNEEVSAILNQLKNIKINEDYLTTKDFYVSPHNVYDNDLKEYIFVDYRGEHKIDIKIDNDSDLINRILSMLNDNEFTPRVSISFGLKDESIIKEEALKIAIDKAKKNAKIIAVGLDVKLGNIQDVKYNFGEQEVFNRRYDYLEEVNICKSSCDFNIMSEDSSHNESVSIVWEIENN
ncbi:SIMPL domain-containing protein [Romboutsia sp.]|uniref:SIMPL domain-containing protein n=1 Tax=Romboutsia sp. TaxID=1965302 RepID=UPI003F2E4A7D